MFLTDTFLSTMSATAIQFIFLLLFTSTSDSGFIKQVKFRLTNLKCVSNPSSQYNNTNKCFIKPYRNGTQLTTVLMDFEKPCDDFWVHFIVSYKFGGGNFRQWMFNYDENVCEWFDKNGQPSLWMKLVKIAVDQITPRTIHPCPFYKDEGIKAINIDLIVSKLLPQVVPTGDYRILMRYHTKTNDTILTLTLTSHIDAMRPLEAMPMG